MTRSESVVMLRSSVIALTCSVMIACAASPAQYDMRPSIGPCRVGFDTEGDTPYAVLDRSPGDPNFTSGAYWAVITFFITNKDGTGPVTLTAKPSEDRVPIRSLSPITGYAPGSCRAFDSPPVLLSRGKG
jgi:hypothetical protein